MKKLVTILIVCLGLILPVTLNAAGEETMAPNFTLEKLDGGDFTLFSQQGKVVLIFFLGYDCPNCKSASSSIQTNLISPYASNENFVSVGIDTWQGNATQVNSFKLTTGLDITYCLDGHTIVNSYGLNNYYDRLVVVDKDGYIVHKGISGAGGDVTNAQSAIDAALASGPTVTAINNREVVTLKQNYPNPFTEATIIPYSIESSSKVTLSILDITGKTLAILVNEEKPKGNYEEIFDGSALSGGVYFYKLEANNRVYMGKMLLQK